MNDTLYGASRMDVTNYLSLRRQFMSHEKACEHIGLDPVVFVPQPGEARAFVKR
jgi:hypothetical protein